MSDTAKQAAGRAAAGMVEDGWTVGLGTGSTAAWAIRGLGDRVAAGLRIVGVPTSLAIAELAHQYRIPLVSLEQIDELDVDIDGADEVDPQFRLIKGGGGALVREKLVAIAARRVIIVAGSDKRVERLGGFPVPVAILPFGYSHTLRRLQRHAPEVRLRERNGGPFMTDDGHFIADLHCNVIPDPHALLETVRSEPGVVDAGLFLDIATDVVYGYDDGHTETLRRQG